jgi:hypothetical protein
MKATVSSSLNEIRPGERPGVSRPVCVRIRVRIQRKVAKAQGTSREIETAVSVRVGGFFAPLRLGGFALKNFHPPDSGESGYRSSASFVSLAGPLEFCRCVF